MRVTISLRNQHGNFGRKIFRVNFRRFSKYELITGFNVVLSCEPDNDSYSTNPVTPGPIRGFGIHVLYFRNSPLHEHFYSFY